MSEAKFCLRCGTALAPSAEDSLGTGERSGPSRPKCPACGWTHYGNPTPVVAGIVEHREGPDDAPRVILVRNHGWPPKWLGLVTGFLEANETPEDGIVREVREELGLDATHPTLVGVYAFAQRNELIVAYHVTAVGPITLGAELELHKRIAIEKLQPWPFGTGLALRDWLARR
jgi:NADH pyrophosphatase NudC (nudix superfamily)